MNAQEILLATVDDNGRIAIAAVLPIGGVDLERLLREIDMRLTTKALASTHGHQTLAAKLLRISFRAIRHRIKKYQIEPASHRLKIQIVAE